jgi:hypothetical protein
MESGFSDSKLMRRVAVTHGGTFLVEGKSTYVFELADGRQVKGSDVFYVASGVPSPDWGAGPAPTAALLVTAP